jgi:hypothetical protein
MKGERLLLRVAGYPGGGRLDTLGLPRDVPTS